MRTSGLLLMDTPLPDGQIFIDPTSFMLASADATLTRAGKGLVSIVVPANGTTVLPVALSKFLFRYGMSDDAQQQYGQGSPSGGYQGAQAQSTTATTPFTTPYGNTGRPPFLAGANLVPPSSIPKGIAINSISLVYQVLGANLTSATFGLSKTKFASGVAPVVTDLIAVAQNGIVLAVAAQPTITTIQNPNQNVMLTDTNSEYIAETTLVAPVGSTVNVYGMFVNVAFNNN